MRIFLIGALGTMGKQVISSHGKNIVCGIDREKSVFQGVNVYNSFDDVKEKIDCILDFSSPSLLDQVLEFAKFKKLPLVICCTGHTPQQIKRIKQASKFVPIMLAANTSVGVLALKTAVKLLSQKLEWDCEIIETHHKSKKDAPSGTAKEIAKQLGCGAEKVHSLRGGQVGGCHQVIFLGNGEELLIKHTAFDKRIYVEGAIRACRFLHNANVGFYSMNDL